MSAIQTLHPLAANKRAAARPRPLAPPVTSTTFGLDITVAGGNKPGYELGLYIYIYIEMLQ
jgi:hypothetical protein